MSLDENKAGAAAVDPSDFNTVVDAVVALEAGSLPAGGTTGQVLTKASNAEGDADWETAGGSGIPQGGPLTQALLTDSNGLKGSDSGDATGAEIVVYSAQGANGGNVNISTGDPDGGGDAGVLQLYTGGAYGAAGEAAVSNGSFGVGWGGVIVAAGVPSGAPAGMLPFAYDTTAVSGGFYFWNGAAWVKIATIL